MPDLNNNIFNENIAGDTSNILIPDSSGIKSGVVFKSNINSNILNGYYNLLSKAIQYLQFTCGLYNQEAYYNEGNIASLIIKNGNNYSIWQFRRNSNNPQVLNNNPPITGASITTINGIDIYEGGTLNTDWDKLTEDYDVEATPNTVMIRDEEGASNVNMPSNIENTTVVNNEYLEEQLQAGLSTKQDKLTAGTNVEITEDNVINVQGDVATVASQVTQTNEALGANVQTALDILNSRYMIPCYYEQLTDDNGNFLEEEEPANWYLALYGVTTEWELVHNTKSVVFRTEGNKSSIDRVNGLQPYGIKNISGNFGNTGPAFANTSYGVFNLGYPTNLSPNSVTGNSYQIVEFSISSQIKTYPDDVVMDNLPIRKYKLISINGVLITDLLKQYLLKQYLLNKGV